MVILESIHGSFRVPYTAFVLLQLNVTQISLNKLPTFVSWPGGTSLHRATKAFHGVND